MVDFLIENWQICVSVLLAFFTLLAQFAKSKRVSYSWKDYALYVFQAIPRFIIWAEEELSDGESKKAYVMKRAMELFKTKVDISSLSVKQVSYIEDIFSKYIEEVLNAPQKKEVK